MGAFFSLFNCTAWFGLLNRAVIKNDLVAGIIAGVLILPQAVALATLAGMPPEYGLYTSIFPVIIASLFGSSWQALSGPNTALAIMIATALAPYASLSTPDYIMYAITLSCIVGVIQLLFAVFKLGAVFNYFSETVLIALITAVGITIILRQSGDFMGIIMNVPEDIDYTLYRLFFSAHLINGYAVTVGVTTILVSVLSRRYRPTWPHHIVAILVGTLMAEILDLLFGSATTAIDRLGHLSLSVAPFSHPDFSPGNFAEAAEGLMSAGFSIALMGLIQSTIIARGLATKTGQLIDNNKEVASQGLSNIAGSFLSCFPACGSFNRSAANLEAGALTPLAGIVSALALALLVFGASPLIARLPMPVMAGVLFIVAVNLIKLKDIKRLLAIRSEARIIFVVTLITALYGNLADGVFLGVFLSIVAYLRSVSVPEIELLFGLKAEQYRPAGVERATVLKVSGSLFFGSVNGLEKFLVDLNTRGGRQGSLVMICEQIQNMDESALEVLIHEALKRREAGGDLFLWLGNHKLDTVIRGSRLPEVIGDDHLLYHTG
ncbi:SulP family inorganic anion transporter [Candidatus Thiosymbion oneisti]|uniref:SulP family inorganic anion transporter n=1 Tax=Candidatus Thiosymbion oneisti TaxID=589554 RepID=UPI000B802D6C|nr:SulP family inorganic anion transporter [Candidatus Thiosymbion oneisti]